MMKRSLTTTTAALTLLIAGAAGAQTVTSDTEMDVGTQAGDAAEEMVDTGQAAGNAAADAVESGVDAAGDVAGEAAGVASDMANGIDAALTADAIVMSSDGETIGTVTQMDANSGQVVVDLDEEMEGSFERPVENVVFRADSFTAADGGVMLDMTRTQLASAVNARLAGDTGTN